MVLNFLEHLPYNVQVCNMAAKMSTARRKDKMLNSIFLTRGAFSLL